MKTTLLALVLALTGLELWAQQPPGMPGAAAHRPPRFGNTNGPVTQPRYQPQQPAPGAQGVQSGAPGTPGTPGGAPGAAPQSVPTSSTYAASSAFAAQPEQMFEPGFIQWEGVEVTQVLDIYAKLVNRTLIRGALPQAQIILHTQTELTKTETIQVIQAVLALNGISLVNIGDKFVKVLPSTDAGAAAGELDRSASTNLPNLGSYLTHVVQLKYIKPTLMMPIITPFAKLKDIIPLDDNGILVIRDYAENVKRMLELIEQVDVSVPAEYISEVIPIRYAKVDDIASALNALGGSGGGATVSIGTSAGSGQISGLAPSRSGSFGGTSTGIGGVGGAGGYQSGGIGGGGLGGQNRPFGGATTPNGTPNNASTFQQRLQNIINSTAGGGGGAAGGKQDQIQLFGQTKIIPNESSSSLLIYATRADMEVIKGIISKLDIPLAQVLVEAAIIDYSLGPNTFNFGVSAAQNPAALNPSGSILGGGGMNNGQSFISFLRTVTSMTNGLGTNGLFDSISKITSITSSAGTNGTFGNNLPGGLSYFGNIGPTWDVAMTAAASDSHASVIQRPRIQTSQAKPAQFFVGDTVPYVTGNSYGTAYGSGVSYSQLSVGVELDVTPFINPDGLVVMDIQQEIDDLNGYTAIANVGNVPNTIKRTLNAEIAVRDRDTVMLGGFIKANKSTSRQGVPFLMDIPILGNLFTQRQDNKGREELIVLMRPTVLKTPELAAKNTISEQQRLPGVSAAEAENAADERKLIDAQRKREQKRYKDTKKYDGFFVPPPEDAATNIVTEPEDAAMMPQTENEPPTQPAADLNPANPVPPVAPPQTKATAPAAPVTPPASQPSATNSAARLDAAAKQQKAAAALAKKMMELNSTNAPR
jgi:general secretion pathway protein D